MLKNYSVLIESRNEFVLPDGIPPSFRCTVSEPSVWAAAPRGLTITDERGVAINNHPVFTHRYNFVKELPGNPAEQIEVDALIWSMLGEANITLKEVNVKVSYIGTTSN